MLYQLLLLLQQFFCAIDDGTSGSIDLLFEIYVFIQPLVLISNQLSTAFYYQRCGPRCLFDAAAEYDHETQGLKPLPNLAHVSLN